ncbi:Hpt domain-containing protein [Winogradskyella haliclonae]|uniref:Histidine kinase n=1 Tax=Winogradskyella haliclonae TaxID=2048558 RepID=A0ABQ2BWE0_9FLAO|nr:Hpt domain-containing protein [Winogradskyella haliclonae]GGI56176.1 histidine kinase [Winogradskyella haliclonae]
MQESPTLNYIKEIAGDDKDYVAKLLTIIKTEFPLEKEQFIVFYKQQDFRQCAEMVHKLKHKINILGLEKSYEVARDFENQLKNNNDSLYPPFYQILMHIENYLDSL